MYNEIHSIERCLQSVLKQNYPQDKIEILVVDGLSTDGSRKIVLGLLKTHKNIHLLENPKRRTPISLNIGIKNSTGDVIIILGAHTKLHESFIQLNIKYMQEKDVKCTGGTQINIGDTYIQKAIGYAMGSPFGIPSAPYRFRKKEQFVDTVVYAAYKKELFNEIGLFDENLIISEDAEFNWRIRQAGYKIFYSPKIKTYYYPRENILKLIKQLFHYGILRVNVIKKHIDAIKLIHLLPMLFILLSFSLIIMGISHSIYLKVLAIIWLLYLSCIIIVSFITGFKVHIKYFPLLPIIFLSIHISWGIGFLAGIFKTQHNYNKELQK